jgi:hypothetical protein
VGSEPRISERPRKVPYIPDSIDDFDLESEIVRHAEPMHVEPAEEARATAASYSREAESTYVSLVKGAGAVPEEPPSIETVSSVNISYDADDLEIPAFLRKRGKVKVHRLARFQYGNQGPSDSGGTPSPPS